MKRAVLLSLCFLTVIQSPSQEYKILSPAAIDSLVRLLPSSESRNQVDILNMLAYSLAPGNFDSSIRYSARAARLATQTGYERGLGLARFNTGNAYYYRLEFKNALLSYLSAQSLLENGPYNNELGEVCLMLGHINFLIRRCEKAVSFYRTALKYADTTHNDAFKSVVYDAMGLAICFLECESTDTAVVYGIKQLNYARKIRDRNLEARALSDIGMFYSVEKASLRKKKMALVYCDSALRLAEELDNRAMICVITLNLGGYYDRTSYLTDSTLDLVRSRRLYQKSYEAARQIESNSIQAICLNALAAIDIEEGKYDKARIRLDSSEARLKDFFQFDWKLRMVPPDIVNALGKPFEYVLALREQTALYKARYQMAMATADYRKAVDYLQSYYQSKDTMYAAQQGKQLELLIAEDEQDRQAQKIQSLEQDNELNRLRLSKSLIISLATGTGIVLVSVILLLFFQRKRLRAERRSVMMEQRLLRAQMNPHFIFNSLASIQNFVINENSDLASIYLSRFSQLVRNILDNSVEDYVPLEKEIETIENYLELQKVRYAGKFDHTVEVDERIDRENMLIPPMLAQPFIENAIEHGIRHKDGPGHIEIRFRLTNGLIRFEVEDDGVGRERAKEIEQRRGSRHRSMATSITRDRLTTLNRKLKKKIRLEIIDLKDASGKGCGTRVEFGIPVVVR
jgi:hypothetical protein